MKFLLAINKFDVNKFTIIKFAKKFAINKFVYQEV